MPTDGRIRRSAAQNCGSTAAPVGGSRESVGSAPGSAATCVHEWVYDDEESKGPVDGLHRTLRVVWRSTTGASVSAEHPAAHTEPPSVTVSVQGDDAMTGAVQAGAAMLRLLDTLTEEIAPDSGLRWSVGAMGWRCDGCGLRVGVERPEDWTKDGNDDLCGECSQKKGGPHV